MTAAQDLLRQRAREAIHSQEWKTPTVLSSLLAVEDALGWIPSEAVEEVAAFTSATINDVWGVATYYTNFRFTLPAQHTLEVCWGLSCHLVGASSLARHTLDTLGLSNEGDTPDGRVTFRFNTCLGACARAPAISIDHKVIGPMSQERLRELLPGLLDDSLLPGSH